MEAGQQVNEYILRQKQHYEQDLEKLQKERLEALKMCDKEMENEIDDLTKEIRHKLAETHRIESSLRLDRTALLELRN
jgi:hypothetical protein